MRVRSIALLVFISTASSIAVGCGGDEGDAASSFEVTTSDISKAQFIKQANAACGEKRAAFMERLNSYSEKNGAIEDTEGTPAYVDVVMTVFVPMLTAEVDAVQAIDVPAGQEQKVEELLLEKQKAIDQVGGDEVQSFGEIEDRFGRANRMLLSYDLDDCTIGARPTGAG